ncbi:MAG: hypothetical protein N2257_10225, partial [Thermodesulfovibrionales bacterium]|nr:hypothetical protein [Thermodesulfovibrionales bacterium]
HGGLSMSDVLTRIAAVEKLLLEVQNQVSQASDRATTRQLFLLLETSTRCLNRMAQQVQV